MAAMLLLFVAVLTLEADARGGGGGGGHGGGGHGGGGHGGGGHGGGGHGGGHGASFGGHGGGHGGGGHRGGAHIGRGHSGGPRLWAHLNKGSRFARASGPIRGGRRWPGGRGRAPVWGRPAHTARAWPRPRS